MYVTLALPLLLQIAYGVCCQEEVIFRLRNLPCNGHCFVGEGGKNINPYPANVEKMVSS